MTDPHPIPWNARDGHVGLMTEAAGHAQGPRQSSPSIDGAVAESVCSMGDLGIIATHQCSDCGDYIPLRQVHACRRAA